MNHRRSACVLFGLYFALGSLLGWLAAALTRAVASGRPGQAAVLDMALTGLGMLACRALIERKWAAVVGYILGGGFGTWIVT